MSGRRAPASLNGIRRGDILVGPHVWETIDRDNIDFVRNHPDFRTINPLKFYIVRGGETLVRALQSDGGPVRVSPTTTPTGPLQGNLTGPICFWG